MRWSALKTATEQQFATVLQGRVCLYAARHHQPSRRGSVWLTFDGEEIARACDWVFTRTQYWTPELIGQIGGSSGVLPWGEMSGHDFKKACWALVHEGPEAAFTSPYPLLRALALLHHKVGKRRVLAALDQAEITPLEAVLGAIRAKCEGWTHTPQTRPSPTEHVGTPMINT